MLSGLIIAGISLLPLSLACGLPIRRRDLSPLQFSKNGTFHISIFNDLHFGENAWDSWGPQQDINSVKVIETVLDAEAGSSIGAPDVVVLNGDLITGENQFLENGTHYIDRIVAPLVNRSLSWACTYGNHDSDYNLSRVALLAREQTWSGSRTVSMVNSSTDDASDVGVTNYVLPVYPSDCQGVGENSSSSSSISRRSNGSDSSSDSQCLPALLLWFFDSRGGMQFQQKDPSTGAHIGLENWVAQPVVEWFQQANANFVLQNGNQPVPALAFVHIPTNASLALQQQEQQQQDSDGDSDGGGGSGGINPNRQPGINDDKPLAQQAQGWCANGTNPGTSSCPYGGQDLAFMQAVGSTPGLMALFSGHDHGDTWCAGWDGQVPPGPAAAGTDAGTGTGPTLCFGQHGGYGGYGNWIRGARQVVVSEDAVRDGVVDTYIRLESGETVGAVSLNSTYGTDMYPATANEKTSCPTCNYRRKKARRAWGLASTIS